MAGAGSRSKNELPKNWPKKALYIQADQSKGDSAKQVLKALSNKGWKKLDNLVLNAGSGQVVKPEEEEILQIRRSFSINLLAPILMTRVLHPLLECGETGKVTLIGSTARSGNPMFASYCANKAGLAGFSRALQSEWKDGINVQLIDLGPVANHSHHGPL